MKRFLALLVLLSPFVSCSSNGKAKSEPQRTWECNEGDDCVCFALKPDSAIGGYGGVTVDRCTGYACCLFDERETPATTAECKCFDSTVSCEAEAASRPGVTIVTQCPPKEEDHIPPAACAQPDENCRSDYLFQHGLAGCCDGTLCKPSSENVLVCQPASPAEMELARQCTKVSRSGEFHSLSVVSPTVATSVGTFQYASVRSAFADLGPAACLIGLRVTLENGSGGCTLELDVGVVEGRLAVTSVSGFLDECPGYTGATYSTFVYETNPPDFGFAFNGVSCVANAGTSDCVAGTFDWRLAGVVDGVDFGDQHLVANGAICSSLKADVCPSVL